MRTVVWSSVFLTFLLALAPAYWTALHNPLTGTYHDDGIYLVTAKALATGQGYRIISLPEPIVQTKYPPVYPWLLSLVWRVTPLFPRNVTALLSVSLIFSIIWMGAIYVLAKQEGLPLSAVFLVIAVSASSAWILGLSTMALSETTFAALCTGSLVLLKAAEARQNRWLIVASALLGGFAFLTRTIGISALVTGPIWLLYKRHRQAAILFSVIALFITGPWFLWGMLHHDPLDWVRAYYSGQSYKINSVLFSFSSRQKAEIISTNLLYLFLSPALLLNLVPGPFWLGLGADLLFFVLLARAAFRHGSLLSTICIIYIVVLICTAGGEGARYIVPIFPFLLILVVQGWGPKNRLASLVVAALAGLFCHSAVRLYTAADYATEGHSAWTCRDKGCGQAEFLRLISWIQANVPTDEVICANLDPLFYLYTGRKAVRGFAPDYYQLLYRTEAKYPNPAGTAEQLRRELRTSRVRYLVMTPDEFPFLQELKRQLIQECPSTFCRVYRGRLPGYEIFAVDWKKL